MKEVDPYERQFLLLFERAIEESIAACRARSTGSLTVTRAEALALRMHLQHDAVLCRTDCRHWTTDDLKPRDYVGLLAGVPLFLQEDA